MHIQLVFLNFLQADIIGTLFFGSVGSQGLFVCLRGKTQHLPQGRHDFPEWDLVVPHGTDAILRSTGCLNDYMVTGFHFNPGGVKEINLGSGAELNVHNIHRRIGSRCHGPAHNVRLGGG